jgi:hypothetical protein
MPVVGCHQTLCPKVTPLSTQIMGGDVDVDEVAAAVARLPAGGISPFSLLPASRDELEFSGARVLSLSFLGLCFQWSILRVRLFQSLA